MDCVFLGVPVVGVAEVMPQMVLAFLLDDGGGEECDAAREEDEEGHARYAFAIGANLFLVVGVDGVHTVQEGNHGFVRGNIVSNDRGVGGNNKIRSAVVARSGVQRHSWEPLHYAIAPAPLLVVVVRVYECVVMLINRRVYVGFWLGDLL